MEIEYEAKFANIDKSILRKKLKDIGAKLIKAEFLQRRKVFKLPKGNEIEGGWLRVRDEGDRVTMSLKVVDGSKIKDQKETMLIVDNFDSAASFLEEIGCVGKAYQENKREIWDYNGIQVTLDEWPYLEPYIEIEGSSERKVKDLSTKLGFDWQDAIFGALDVMVNKRYGVPFNIINNHTPQITFKDPNPWIDWQKRV